MKKILVLFFVFAIASPSFAFFDKKARLEKCLKISEQAEAKQDNELFKNYAMCVYRTNKKGVVPEAEIKILDNQALGLIVKYYANRYIQTKNKKDLELAEKFSFVSMKNKTEDIENIYNIILVFALALDEDNMIFAYEYLNKISPNNALQINSQFAQNIDKVREIKSLLKHNRNYEIKKRIGTVLYSVGYDMPSYAGEAGNYYKKAVPTACYSIENVTYSFAY